jgi:branched-chain amino acid transport system ATP-binding protein
MILSVKNVCQTFGGLRALQEVSMQMKTGEILGVIGPNGAGKSTLFGTISGEIKRQQGEIYFQGKSISDWAMNKIAKAGLVKTFQTSRPFASMTFQDNVAIGALSQGFSIEKARLHSLDCLERVGLGNQFASPAFGASTGQRKRLEIARALATNPQLLLLDEPFGGVDIAAVDSLINLIKSLREQGLSILLIEHNIAAVTKLVDRLIAMHLGQVIAQGSTQDVTTNRLVVSAYMGVELEHSIA